MKRDILKNKWPRIVKCTIISVRQDTEVIFITSQLAPKRRDAESLVCFHRDLPL